MLPQLKRDKMVGAPASLDATWVREENLLPIGGPYQIQAINALDYYVKEGGGEGKNICSMIQDDAYGEAGQAGVEFAAEKLGFELVDHAALQDRRQGRDRPGTAPGRTKCDAVFLVATPSDAGTIWGTAAKLGSRRAGSGSRRHGSTSSAPRRSKEYLAKTTWIASEGTEWGDTEVAGHEADARRHQGP